MHAFIHVIYIMHIFIIVKTCFLSSRKKKKFNDLNIDSNQIIILKKESEFNMMN